MIKIILLVLLAEAFMTLGHLLFKKTTNTLMSHSFRSIPAHFRFLREVFAKPLIWTGFLSMAVGLVIWLVALAQGDLSLVFPISSLQFILTLFSANIFLNEKIDTMKLLGTFLVVFGIVLIAIS